MVILLWLGVSLAVTSAAKTQDSRMRNLWIAHIEGGENVARGVASDLGLTYQDKGVLWARQQVISENSKYHLTERDEYQDTYDHDKEQADIDWFLKSVNQTDKVKHCKLGPFACVDLDEHLIKYLASLGETDVTKLGTITTKPAHDTTLSSYTGTTLHLVTDPRMLSAYAFKFSDPSWRKQWYMQDYRTTNFPVMDHNIVPVLNMGITGRTITVAVIGDGIKYHPDLGDNFVESISYDFCEDKKGCTPFSKVDVSGKTKYDDMGTTSAGVIGMEAGNDDCGVGIAPGVRIAGLRTIGCESPKPEVEANSLKYNLDGTDIYCNTWTTDDEFGKKIVPLSYPVETALKMGVTDGRKHKGAIYVFPSGLYRTNNNCAFNGYLNNPYVLTIGSVASDGKASFYSERCTAIFAAAYSGDKYEDTFDVITTKADGSCGAYDWRKPIAPAMASGIIALVLQHKPKLTYRDIMHLIAMSAEVAPLADNKHSWYRNGRGIWVSSDFGFGLLNAENMITLASDWKKVPDKGVCVINHKINEPLFFDHKTSKSVTIEVSECKPQHGKQIMFLEHVEVEATIDYYYRGAIYMNITSPAGTNTELLEPRVKDFSKDKLDSLNIMSVHNWGENPKGKWNITVMACNIKSTDLAHGFIHEFTLKLHGTHDKPAHYDKPRKYAAFRLPNGDTNKFV